MQLDPNDVGPRDFYRHMIACIIPRPIAWVSTVSPKGIANLAPFSFFNGVGAHPPSVVFCPTNDRHGRPKDTLRNVQETRQFCINIVPHRLALKMNVTSIEYDYEDSEFPHAGLAEAACVKIRPPRVAEAPVAMECELHTLVAVGEGPLAGHAVIGRIVMMHINDSVLDADGAIDPAKLDTIGRMGGPFYATTRDRFAMPRPDRPITKSTEAE